jgi:hypothetical protein
MRPAPLLALLFFTFAAFASLLAQSRAGGSRHRGTSSGRIGRRDPSTAANVHRAQAELPFSDYKDLPAKLNDSAELLQAHFTLVYESGSKIKPTEYLALRLLGVRNGIAPETAKTAILRSATAKEAAADMAGQAHAAKLLAQAKKELEACKDK